MNLKKTALAVVMLGLIVIAYFSYKIYAIMLVPNTAFNSKEAYIFISTGATYFDVRSDLEPLLLDIEKFDALAKQKKYDINIKAGRYRIAKDMTNNDIINSLRSQNLAVTVAFNNQHSLGLLAQRISNQVEADSLSLMEVFTDSVFLSSNAFTKESALAMYLPNSYEFFWNTSPKKIRSKLYKAYNNFWTSSRKQKAQGMGLTPVEVSILAAIVQEESKELTEQSKIAGVYMNRLKNNWALQADPTLKFAAYQTKSY